MIWKLAQSEDEWTVKLCFERKLMSTVLQFLEEPSLQVKQAAIRAIGALASADLEEEVDTAIERDDVLTYLFNYFDYEGLLQRIQVRYEQDHTHINFFKDILWAVSNIASNSPKMAKMTRVVGFFDLARNTLKLGVGAALRNEATWLVANTICSFKNDLSDYSMLLIEINRTG